MWLMYVQWNNRYSQTSFIQLYKIIIKEGLCCKHILYCVFLIFLAPPTSPLVKVISTTSSTMELKWEKNIKSKSAVTGKYI